MDLKSCRILVTPTSFGKYNKQLKTDLEETVGEVIYNTTGHPLTSDELVDILPGIDGYIAGLDWIDDAALAAADKLKVIARYGVGVDRVDLDAAEVQGITITNTPGANSASVAELTIGLILSLARHIPKGAAATRKGEWPRMNGLSLQGKTIGLVGLGAIGKQVTRRLYSFDCELLAYDPYPDNKFAEKHGVTFTIMDELLGQSDFVSLHLPLLPETQGIINADAINKMKNGAYIINTSRGELIEDSALLDAIQSKKLAGAALDVFAKEPPDKDNPLLKQPEIIVTPHCASHTDGATDTMAKMAMDNCLAVLSGEEPANRVR
jgi:D-3-phosphoglycerate dehydrogenase